MPSRWEEAWKEAAARNVAELEAAGVRVSEAEYARLDAGGGLSREETFLDASCELLLLLRARFLGIASKSAARGFVENLEECLALFADHGNSEKALQTLLELQRAIEGSEDLPSKRKRTLRAVARKAFFATARAVDSKGDGPAAGAALPFLPPTVLSHAFRHLSPLDLARCACVSREWRGVVAVGEPRFFRELHRKVCPLVDNGADDRWKKTYLEKATAHGLVFHRDVSKTHSRLSQLCRSAPSGRLTTTDCHFLLPPHSVFASPGMHEMFLFGVVGASEPASATGGLLVRHARGSLHKRHGRRGLPGRDPGASPARPRRKDVLHLLVKGHPAPPSVER